jgi:thymidylate synthase (FAD)
MQVIKATVNILSEINSDDVLKSIELAARTCYKSEDLITEDSAKKLVKRLIESNHEAMLEFHDVTVKFICDRGVSHEIVRHRVASYAQESTRYCNYSKDKFGNELTFISNVLDDDAGIVGADYYNALEAIETAYFMALKKGFTPQQARAILPNSLKTEICMKANLREWRHFFKLRCSPAAHPDMRYLALELLKKMSDSIELIFDDLKAQYLS